MIGSKNGTQYLVTHQQIPWRYFFVSLIVLWAMQWNAAKPVLSAETESAAWPGQHPLTAAQVGSLLIHELKCGACHTEVENGRISEKTAPDLTNVGGRVSPKYLQEFIAHPALKHPGTTMPQLLASRPETDRTAIAEAITHFLVDQSKEKSLPAAGNQSDQQRGKTLYHSIGCVACHGPREVFEQVSEKTKETDDDFDDEPEDHREKRVQPVAFGLDHVPEKYNVASLSRFLFAPLHVRQSGRMPDMKLKPDEALSIAAYLVGDSKVDESLKTDERLVHRGRQYFQELNCAACHSLPGITAAKRVNRLTETSLSRGCLTGQGGKSPQYAVSREQRLAMELFIKESTKSDSPPVIDTDQVAIAKTLATFHCIACHTRDDFGGVPDIYNMFFTGNDLKLGDDGRIPPPLTHVGAKLRPAWLKKVLFDGESVRPYMVTRMPQYGEMNIGHLPEILASVDHLHGKDLTIPDVEGAKPKDRERERLLRQAGRELLGDKGLNCIACHSFNGRSSQGSQGIDLLTSYQRLQPQYFDSYLRNPGSFRPRTVMPTAWPNGVATFTTILDGDTDRQIEAIWYYLSLGTSAADPSGLRSVNTKLVVDGSKAQIHRGRSRIAGYRGIAVGLPEQWNYAFNAETGTISGIWKGDYIQVNWSGQGSGDFQPATEAVTLPQDISFLPFEGEPTAWPRMPVMTKEARTNPDPLYPKNVGYQFRGYTLDKDHIPTFSYRSGAVDIFDRTQILGDPGNERLQRIFRFESPTTQTLWFRGLAGKVTKENSQNFRLGNLRLSIPEIPFRLREIPGQAGEFELLIPVQISQGQSTFEVNYELLSK